MNDRIDGDRSTTSADERAMLASMRDNRLVARNIDDETTANATLGERLADRIARFGGSWTFILLFLSFLLSWAVINTQILGPLMKAFDPYPYIFLNLFLSMIAALQAPLIMMSQNRQSQRDRLHAENDYEVNLKAEVGIRELHTKLNTLREQDWAALVELQQRQIELLTRLVERGDGSQQRPPHAGDTKL